MIYNNILELIGNTPLVRLNKVTKGIRAIILAKLEFFNPGGSIKDRIGIAMLEEAEKRGLIKPGYTIIEPTAGNTGIGLALAAIIKGYNIIFTIPDKMSKEKIDLVKALGARVIITPTNVSSDDPKSYTKVAEKLNKEIPNSFIPNQFFNPANPKIHYETTGPEIWKQTDGKIDILVAGIGTGGTITGIGKYLKEKSPKIKIVGVDPEGSIYHHQFYKTQGEIHSYKVEGIGEDFIPSTFDMKIVDEIILVSDKDSFLMARKLAKEEGIFVGGSGGAAVWAALKVAKDLDKNKTIVVILPDTGRNYLTKIYSDEWMAEYGFIESSKERIPVKEIISLKPRRVPKKIILAKPNDPISKVVVLMKRYDISQLPVIEDGIQTGSIREIVLVKKLSRKEAFSKQKVKEVMEEPFPQVQLKEKILNPFLLLKDKNAVLVLDDKEIVDIITTIDVINYHSKKR